MALKMKYNFFFLGENDKYKFSEDNPFVDPEDEEENGPSPVASVGYRYRLWDLVSKRVSPFILKFPLKN